MESYSKPQKIQKPQPNPQKLPFLEILLISFFDFGSSFVYDFPNLLSTPMLQKINISSYQSVLLYSAYSFPNMFVCLLGGFLIFKIGHINCLRIYTILVTLGYFVFIFGIFYQSFAILFAGRLIAGLGSENLMITQYYTSQKTLSSKYLSFAIGMNQSISFLGSIIAYYLIPEIFTRTDNLRLAVGAGSIPIVLSLVCIIFFTWKKKREMRLEKNLDFEKENEKIYLNESEENSKENINSFVKENKSSLKKIFKISDLKKFSWAFWILCCFTLTTSASYFQFMNISIDFVKEYFVLNYSQSKNITALIPTTLMLIIPLISFFSDRYGSKAFYLLISSVYGLLALLAIQQIEVKGRKTLGGVLLVNFGIFYSFYSAVFWAGVAQLCQVGFVDIGLGIANTFQNCASFLYPIILGKFATDFQIFEKVLMAFLGLSCALSIILLVLDKKDKKLYPEDEEA